MKICTITCHHAFNYGAMLQAFALSHYLQSLGHEVHVIDYAPSYLPGNVNVNFRWVPSRYDLWGVRLLYRYAKYRERQRSQIRRNALEGFYNKYIPITQNRYYSVDELKSFPPVADLFVAGSDQIWNTTFQNGKDAAFYLDFGSPKRKISYAASFATETLQEGTDEFVVDKLRSFDAISVRESSGLRLLRSLGYDGIQVVDPVFLIDREGWDLFDGNNRVDDNYILTYDFEYRNSVIGPIAKRIAKQRHCKIYSISPVIHSYDDKYIVEAGPDDFVYLIKHAECIISNSFHGTAFSMIFEKDFFVVNRKDGLNIRMRELLSRYGLSERLISEDVSDERLTSKIDFESVNKLLAIDIDSSKAFLRNQIELAK